MKSIRTKLSVLDTNLFKIFLEAAEVTDVLVGDYPDRVNMFQVNNNICYAYSEKNEKAIANMTYMSLKYGSVENAFKDYKLALERSSINDDFYWTP